MSELSHPLHSIPPSPLFSSTVASAFTTAPRSPACPPTTSSSRPSRTPAYAPPRMRCRSSSPSRATSSPCSRAGSTPTSARRFAQATSTFGRTAAHPRWTMVASPWSGGTLVVAPLLRCPRLHSCVPPLHRQDRRNVMGAIAHTRGWSSLFPT